MLRGETSTTLELHVHQKPGRRQTISTYIFHAVVCAAPLPFGSNNLNSLAIWCGSLAVALFLIFPARVRPGQTVILAGLMSILLGYLLVAIEQSTNHPLFVRPAPIWASAASLLNTSTNGLVGFVASGPFISLGPILACALALSLGLVLGANGAQARRTLMVIGLSGAAYAVYGIIAAAMDPTMLLGREREDYIGVVLGTFINRNTAATYFGACGSIWLVLLCQRLKRSAGGVTASSLSLAVIAQVAMSKAERRANVREGLCLLVCVTALFMTNSRAGVLCSLVGMAGAVGFIFHGDLLSAPRKSRIIVAGGLAICLFFLAVGGAVNHRFDAQGFSDEGRIDIYRSTLRMIEDHPWFGVGLGGFRDVFPLYRGVPPSIWGVWDMAHSTPLQIAAEAGLPLAALLCLAMFIAFGVLVRGVVVRRRNRAIPLIAATVLFIGVTHSCVDFSLQIPGFAIVFMAVIGTGLGQSFPSARIAMEASPSLARSPTGA